MAKKKRNKGVSSSSAAVRPPVSSALSGVFKLSPRWILILSIAFLCLLCLIQYWGILIGGRNFWEDVAEGEFPARVFARLALFRGEFPHWNPFTFGGMPFFATGAGIFYPFNFIQSLLPVGDAAMWRVIEAVIVLHVLIAGVNMLAYLRFNGRSAAAALFGAVAFMFGGYIVTHVIHSSIMYVAAWLPLMLLLLEKGVRELKPAYMVIGGLLLGSVMQMGHPQVMFYAVVFMLTYALFLCCRYGFKTESVSTGSTSILASLKKPINDAVMAGSTRHPHESSEIGHKPALDKHGAGQARNDSGRKSVSTKYKPVFRRVALSALYFVIAAGICMVQYLPIFEAGGHTVRSQFTIADASEGSLQFVQLLTALIPKFFGAFTGGGDESIPSFWLTDAFKHGYYNYWESCFYFGVSTLILSVLFFRKIKTDSTAVFAAAWILLAFLIALGGNFFFYKILFNLGIPGFNSFRHTPRILFVWAFIFPVMAAAVLDGLSDLKRSSQFRIITLSLCAAAAVLGLIAASGSVASVFPLMNIADGKADRALYASRQGMTLLVNAALFGAVLILFFKNIVNEKWAKILMVACVSIDMLVFAAGQHITSRDGADVLYNRAHGTVETIKKLSKEEIFRVNMRQYIVEPGAKLGNNTSLMMMPRNQGYVSAVEIMEGYNQFRLKNAALSLDGANFNTFLDLMNIRYYVNPHPQEGDKDIMLRNETCLPRAKLFYKAVVVGVNGVDNSINNNSINDDRLDSLIINYMNSPIYDHRNEVVVTDPSLSKFTGINGTGSVKIVKRDFNRIELDVDTDKEAILWLSEILYPAWKAEINGNKTKVYRADYSFRAITVPAGYSKVVFKFDSLMFNIGALISGLTLLLSLMYLVLVIVRRKNV
ncbi:hypothetical protein R80B4_01478 [Fibrobacteres bacterium R8-0-B4]